MMEIFKGKDGQHYFRVVAGNGQIVAQSEGYVSASNAQRGYMALLDTVFEDVAPTELDGDAAIAIGEHAFRAGYKSAANRARAFHPKRIEDDTAHMESAWSEYTPPEEVCGIALVRPVAADSPALTEAVARVIVAEAAVSTDKRRGRK